jgi:hypothetical protein
VSLVSLPLLIRLGSGMMSIQLQATSSSLQASRRVTPPFSIFTALTSLLFADNWRYTILIGTKGAPET